MAASTKNKFNTNNHSDNINSLSDTIRMLSDMTRRDIEKSYNINDSHGTEAYYSDRYGWTLRRTIS